MGGYTFLKCSIVAVLLVFVGCKSSNTSNQQPVDIKFNLPKGKEFRFSTEITNKVDMSMMGANITTNVDIGMETTMKAESVDGEITKVNSIIERFNAVMSIPMVGRQTFDSDKPDQNEGPIAEAFARIVKKPFYILYDKDGRIKGMEGMEAVGDLQGLDLNQVFNQGMATLPGKPVKPGDSWTDEQVIDYSGMKMRLKKNWTVKEFSGSKAVCDVNFFIEILAGPTSGDDGVPANLSGNGKQTGEIEIDIYTGMTTKMDLDADWKMELEAQGQKMPMKMTMSLTMDEL